MKVFFDQGTPVPLRRFLVGQEVATAFEMGWATLQNGELLRAVEAGGFECFVTTDQNLKYQQNLPRRALAIVVILSTSWPRIEPKGGELAAVILRSSKGQYVEFPV